MPPGAPRTLVVAGAAGAALGWMIVSRMLLVNGSLPVLPVSGNPAIALTATHQALVLPLALLFVLLSGPAARARYWRVGDLDAPAGAVRALGITEGQGWRGVAAPFAGITAGATALFMVLNFGLPGSGLLVALPWILLFSACNAFNEEVFSRYHLAAHLNAHLSPDRIALLSGAIFGGLHVWGTPGGLLGALMAGFLGWLLCKAVLETRGLFYAWAIHMLQDVVIFSTVLPEQ